MNRRHVFLAVASVLAARGHAQQSLELNNATANPFGYVRIADHPQLEPAQVSLEAWITPEGPGVGHAEDAFGALVAGKAIEGAIGSYLTPYYLGWSSGTQRVIAIVRGGTSSTGAVVISTRTVPLGSTHHIAMTFDGAFLRLYVDGVLDGCRATTFATIGYGTEPLLFGAANFGGENFERRFDGRIDEVRLWSSALGPDEIIARAGCPLTGSEPGLAAYWSFDAGSLVDDSGNGHTGAAQGTEFSFVAATVPAAPCGSTFGTRYCSPAVPNSTGAPAQIDAVGSPLLADNLFFLVAQSVPDAQFGYFLTSTTQGMFQPPASSGLVCVAGNIGRFNQAGNLGQGPCFTVKIDLGPFPVNPPRAPLAGESWNFQCWYRDGGTSNFTDAVQVVFQ